MIKYFITLLLLIGISKDIKAQDTSYHFPDSFAVKERVFGVTIDDPFRGLENLHNLVVAQWMDQQNESARLKLHNIRGYAKINEQIRHLKTSAPYNSELPVYHKGTTYVVRSKTDQDLVEIVRYAHPSAQGKVIFSTESINKKDHTFYNIESIHPSPDNHYLGLSLYEGGGDVLKIRILDIDHKRLLPDVIDASSSFFPNWLPDSRSFFYTQAAITNDLAEMYDTIKVKLHKIGDNQIQDELLLDRNTIPDISYDAYDFPSFYAHPDGKHLVFFLATGVSPYVKFYVASLSKTLNDVTSADWKLVAGYEDELSNPQWDMHYFYAKNSLHNETGEIVQISIDNPKKRKCIYKSTQGFLEDFVIGKAGIYLLQIENGLSNIFYLHKGKTKTLQLPFKGDADLASFNFYDSPQNPGLYVGLSDWNKAYEFYYYHPDSTKLYRTDMHKGIEHPMLGELVVEEIEVKSYDGELVPLSIIYHKDIKKDSNNPTIIEAYGTYGESIEPYLTVSLIPWYQHGGIMAYAHVRGGGEKGSSWHQAGIKGNKHNSWQDLIACSEYLIKNGYTAADKLGLRGSSAGGIAVGRAITERPDLYRAAALEFPVLNTTRLDKTPVGYAQIEEYGNPEDSVEFQYLYQMDAYLHVKKGVAYPAVLLTAGRNDGRISLWEPGKMAAHLMASRVDHNPTLFRIYEGGHGEGSIEEEIEMDTDVIAFFLWQLGHPDFRVDSYRN